jgi:hypothetical protein
LHGLLCQAAEPFPSRFRRPAIEPERELVEVVVVVVVADGSLMRPEQPALPQRDHAVHAGEDVLAGGGPPLDVSYVPVVGQSRVAPPTVRVDGAAGFDRFANEVVQAVLIGGRDPSQANPTDAGTVLLGRH